MNAKSLPSQSADPNRPGSASKAFMARTQNSAVPSETSRISLHAISGTLASMVSLLAPEGKDARLAGTCRLQLSRQASEAQGLGRDVDHAVRLDPEESWLRCSQRRLGNRDVACPRPAPRSSDDHGRSTPGGHHHNRSRYPSAPPLARQRTGSLAGRNAAGPGADPYLALEIEGFECRGSDNPGPSWAGGPKLEEREGRQRHVRAGRPPTGVTSHQGTASSAAATRRFSPSRME